MTVNREELMVELVDATGRDIGMCTVAEAHTLPGRHHRAYSVLLVDAATGAVLLQRRAAAKTRFPLRWSNTCCGHPAPGHPVGPEAGRRLAEEMGVSDVTLAEAGVFTYRATDPTTGRVEDEHDHVLFARVGAVTVAPDPDEVAEWRWVPLDELDADLAARPDEYTPWLADVIRLTTVANA